MSSALPTNTIRDLLDKNLKDLLDGVTEKSEPKTQRVVVIIDDLDRCQPMVAYKLLEGIKIFLNIESCIFLLGINREEIERSIAIGLTEESGGDPTQASEKYVRSQEYLEKLCGHIWPLPFLQNQQCIAYLDHLLQEIGDFDASLREQIKEVYTDFGDERILPANPRRIKALANCMIDMSRNRISKSGVHEHEAKVIIVLAHLSTFHSAIYRYLGSHPQFLKAFASWASGTPGINFPSDHPSIRALKLPYDHQTKGGKDAVPNAQEAPQFSDLSSVAVLRIQPLLMNQDFRSQLTASSSLIDSYLYL